MSWNSRITQSLFLLAIIHGFASKKCDPFFSQYLRFLGYFPFFLTSSTRHDARDIGYVSRVAPLIRLFASHILLYARVRHVVLNCVSCCIGHAVYEFVSTWQKEKNTTRFCWSKWTCVCDLCGLASWLKKNRWKCFIWFKTQVI